MVGYDPANKDVQLPQYAFGVAGALSGFVTRAISQPLDVLKIRLQLQEQPIRKTLFSKYHGLYHAVKTIWKEETVVAFWKGHAPAQLLSIVFGLVQFSSFELLTKIVWQQLPPYVTVDFRPITHFTCGGLAGCCATLASQPFDVIRTRFVAQGEPKAYKSMIDAVLQIVSKESPRALYRGLVPTLAQIAPQTGFQFGFYSLLTSIWELMFGGQKVNGVHQVGALQSLICGSGAGLCAKVAVYPLDLTKKRLQVQGFGYGRVVTGKFRTYKGFVDCLRSVAVNEGILAMYKGLSASILKAVVTAGIHFSTYEQFCSLFRAIYKSHSR